MTDPDYAQMILDLRHVGISANTIARWGRKHGRRFSAGAINAIIARAGKDDQRLGRPLSIGPAIKWTISDLHARLFKA